MLIRDKKVIRFKTPISLIKIFGRVSIVLVALQLPLDQILLLSFAILTDVQGTKG